MSERRLMVYKLLTLTALAPFAAIMLNFDQTTETQESHKRGDNSICHA